MSGTSTERNAVVVFGSLNVDLVCRVETIARPGETVLGPTYAQLFGGKGANQAVAAARASAGETAVVMIGAVGADDLGAAVIANLSANGVQTEGVLRLPEPTGAAFIQIDAAGENAITVASGANRMLTGDALPSHWASAGAVLVLQMEVPIAADLAAAKAVKAAGGRVLLNLAPVPAHLARESFSGLAELADILIVNESELKAAADCLDLEGDTPEALGAALARTAGLTVVATLGADGALVVREDGATEAVPALAVEPVDTTGAGDTFCGVLAAAFAAGHPLSVAVHRAVVAGSLACRQLGAQSAMPTGEEIDAAMASS